MITYKIKKAKRTLEYLHDYCIQLFKFYNKFILIKRRKKKIIIHNNNNNNNK